MSLTEIIITVVSALILVGLSGFFAYRTGFGDGRKEGVAVGWLQRDEQAKQQQQRHAAKRLRNFNPQN